MKDRINQWLYYFIIGIVSLIALTFLPMMGTTIGLAWVIPDTVVGWIVWITLKIIVAILNVLIFYCFMQQAKINVKDNPKYIEANQILSKAKKKEVMPRSPRKWQQGEYGKKGSAIFITTALSTIALTQAILSFDYVSMLTYLFTIVLGLIFGVIQMKNAELYWTEEYWEYAKLKEQEEEKNGGHVNDNL